MIKTGAQILWECLEQQGVTTVFGYPGGAILPAYDALNTATSITSWCGTSRARRIWPTAMRGLRGAWEWLLRLLAGRDEHGHRHCHGDARLLAYRLHYGPGWQQVDRLGRVSRDPTSPESRCPSPNTIIWSLMPIKWHARFRRRFYVASSGRPVQCSWTLLRTRSNRRAEFDGKPIKPQLPGYRPDLSPTPDEYKQALELIHSAKRPIFLPGTASFFPERCRKCASSRSATISVGLTLLGLGGFPASHPLSLGMMGMHGEAWLNTTIQEADLLIAFGCALTTGSPAI